MAGSPTIRVAELYRYGNQTESPAGGTDDHGTLGFESVFRKTDPGNQLSPIDPEAALNVGNPLPRQDRDRARRQSVAVSTKLTHSTKQVCPASKNEVGIRESFDPTRDLLGQVLTVCIQGYNGIANALKQTL